MSVVQYIDIPLYYYCYNYYQNTYINHIFNIVGTSFTMKSLESISQKVINVLLVDDSISCRNMVYNSLIKNKVEGCIVFCDHAADGWQAVEMIRHNLSLHQSSSSLLMIEKIDSESSVETNLKLNCTGPYDVILMDYQMPVMDGPTAIKQAREMGFRGKIVGLTGNVLPKDLNTMKEAGANEVLTKPVKTSSLQAIISDASKK